MLRDDRSDRTRRCPGVRQSRPSDRAHGHRITSRYASEVEAALHPWPALGALLVRDGLVSKSELAAVLARQHISGQQRISGKRLGELLVERGLVTAAQVA